MDREAILRDRRRLQQRWREAGALPDRTLSQALGAGLAAHADVPSFFHRAGREPRAATNRELHADGLHVAAGLRGLGLGPGDVVALQLPTWLETAVAAQAVFHLGAIALPIVHSYGPAEVQFMLRQSRARALVIPDRWRDTDCVARFARMGHLPELRHVVVVGESVARGMVSFDSLLRTPSAGFTSAECDPDDVCLLLYTSGTTAAPKGVRHTHNTLLREWGRPSYAMQGLYLSPLPAGHYSGFGFLLRPCLYGAPSLFMDHWDAGVAAELVVRHRVRHSGGTPIFLVTLLRAAQERGLDLRSLESFGMGGAAMTPALIRWADEQGFPAARVYGSTEHPTVTAFDPALPFAKRAFTDGPLDAGNEVRILGEDGHELPPGEPGEIATRGPELFAGYSDPGLDEESFLPGGWFRTGDIGRIDAEGFLTLTDRKKDIIIRGGENISSREVEEVLAEHPSVAEAAVTAMPDATYGEKVCAYVVLHPGASLSLADVVLHFERSGLAKLKTPERLEVLASLPRTPSGKVKKRELRGGE